MGYTKPIIVDTTNATNISSGTLADARLSSNVPLKNIANVFTNVITAPNFLGNWNGLASTDFVRLTGNVIETITGVKTFSSTINTTSVTSAQQNHIFLTAIDTNSTPTTLNLRFNRDVVGSIPANTWNFRLGGTVTRSLLFSITDGTPGIFLSSSAFVGIGNTGPGEKLDVSGNVKATRFISTQGTGTAPLTVASTTLVNNLNADLLGGYRLNRLPMLHVTDSGFVQDGIVPVANRTSNFNPNQYSKSLSAEFKEALAINFGSGAFTGVLTFASYSGTTGSGAGRQLQIGYDANATPDVIKIRTGIDTTWETWKTLYHDNYHPDADKWTTARTLTIGNSGKSVNGSANVSWSLAEIGAQAAGSYVTTNTTQNIDSSKSFTADNHITFGPNTSWGAYLRVGGNGRTVTNLNTWASVVATDGNIHIDPGTSKGTYLNYYSGTSGTYFGNAANGVVARMGIDGNLWKGGTSGGSAYYHAGNSNLSSVNWAVNNLTVASSTLVTNLNADLLDSLHSTDFVRLTGTVAQTITGVKTLDSKLIYNTGSFREKIFNAAGNGLRTFYDVASAVHNTDSLAGNIKILLPDFVTTPNTMMVLKVWVYDYILSPYELTISFYNYGTNQYFAFRVITSYGSASQVTQVRLGRTNTSRPTLFIDYNSNPSYTKVVLKEVSVSHSNANSIAYGDSSNYSIIVPTTDETGYVNSSTILRNNFIVDSTLVNNHSAQTITGVKTFSNEIISPLININREVNAGSGIAWYNSSYNAWVDYMAPAGALNQGPNSNITPPTGTLVTTWAKRSFIENVSGFGWTFESGSTSSTTPVIVAEIRSADGAAKFAGSVTAPTFIGALNGNASTATKLLGYTAVTAENWANLYDDNAIYKLDIYNIPTATTGIQQIYGTVLGISGRSAHDKTQLIFNGVNGSIQYRKSWWNNTAWTSVRTLWDSNNSNLSTVNWTAQTMTATSFVGSGASVTSLNASNISSGTLADARLSGNVPLKNVNNVFTGDITINGALSVSHTSKALYVINTAVLGSNFNDSKLLIEYQATGNSNSFFKREWLLRHSSSPIDWTTVSYVDGISIDSSFGTPITARTWWKRNPHSGTHTFGNDLTTFISLSSSSTVISSTSTTVNALVATTINTGPGVTEVHLMNQNVRTTDTVSFSSVTSALFSSNSTNSRDKIRVWNSSLYAIGMGGGYTFGGLNGYSMTFQMDSTTNRGFWWGTNLHSNTQGAMSLTNDGRLVVSDSLKLGYGSTNTSSAAVGYKLDISGSTVMAVNNGNYILNLINGTETGFQLRTYVNNNATNTIVFKQGLYHTTTENAAIYFYRGGSHVGGWLGFSTNNGTERMRITASGKVSIGDTNDTYNLDVTGTIRATGDIISNSDSRLKTNIETVVNSLKVLKNIRGVSYIRKSDGTKHLGVIADEIQSVLPELVHTDSEGWKSVAYNELIGVLIESGKSTLEMVESNEKKIKRLELEVEQLKSKLNGTT